MELNTNPNIVNSDRICPSCCEYYGSIDNNNLCSDCYAKTKGELCRLCSKYYKNENDLCSQCDIKDKYKDKYLSMTDIIKLPNCDFKGKKLNEILEELFETFMKTRDHEFKLVKTKNMRETLINMCKNKTPNEIKGILNGNNDFFGCFIYARDADIILNQFISSNKYIDVSEIINAVCPFVIDVWNLVNDHSVLLCYYKDFGDLVKCPNDEKRLYELWSRY